MSDATTSRPLVDDAAARSWWGQSTATAILTCSCLETSERVSAADLLESLKGRSADAERAVANSTSDYRQSRQRSGEKAPATIELKSRLATSVAEAFERRQQAQRLEAEILRVKLQRVDARLMERERSKNGIISRRVDELVESSGPEQSNLNVQPTESSKPRRSNRQRASAAENNEVFPRYAPRGHALRGP